MNQDVYQQTHPIFFTDRAIYVIVYSLRLEISTADLTRQLMNVTTRCPDARIVVVATHADEAGEIRLMTASFVNTW